MEKESIFQQFRFLRQTVITLKIILDFDSMKTNMSAISKCKENIRSTCLLFKKPTFSVEKSEYWVLIFGAIFSFDYH